MTNTVSTFAEKYELADDNRGTVSGAFYSLGFDKLSGEELAEKLGPARALVKATKSGQLVRAEADTIAAALGAKLDCAEMVKLENSPSVSDSLWSRINRVHEILEDIPALEDISAPIFPADLESNTKQILLAYAIDGLATGALNAQFARAVAGPILGDTNIVNIVLEQTYHSALQAAGAAPAPVGR